MKKSLVRVGLIALVLLAGLAVYVWAVMAQPYRFHGSVIDPASPAPALILPATDGTSFDLARQRGKINLIFFGYTSCADICPGTLALLRQAVTQMGSQGTIVQVVFITVDPQRDTLEKLRLYVNAFNPGFLGLSGTVDQMDPVWKAYGVYHEIKPNPASPNAYTVDHTAFIYVIDRKGNLRMTYPQGTNIDDMVEDLKILAKEG